VLPNGASATEASFANQQINIYGEVQSNLERVISTDGSRIFWTDLQSTGPYTAPVVLGLYVRENATQPDASTVLIAKDGQYMGASKDGSRVFFTDEENLTSNSTATTGAPDLYEYDLENGAYTDLSVDTNTGEHADVVGVLGASEDGSYVYFAAAGALPDSGATSQRCLPVTEPANEVLEPPSLNKCNVYVVHVGEAPKLVAAVAAADGEEGWALSDLKYGDWVPNVGARSAHVTPDGRHLVFDSIEDLTGFDPEGGQEIYMYDYETDRTSCVSCNPTGVSTTTSSPNQHFEYPHSELPESGSSTFALRDVSVEGDRVFFQSSERLVSQETYEESEGRPFIPGVGPSNVYEWEADDSGSCTAEKGCIFLLSGGTSTDDSVFVDASENGDDAFIETRAQLVPQDHGETYEVYDARVGATQLPAEPACTGSGCQGVPAAPPIFATPSSETFNGTGNFSPPPPPAVVKPKPKTKTVKCAKGTTLNHGKCIKVKAKKKKSKAKKSAHTDRRAS
jgi:hypothetical protein